MPQENFNVTEFVTGKYQNDTNYADMADRYKQYGIDADKIRQIALERAKARVEKDPT